MANDLAVKIKISTDAKQALDGFVALTKRLRDSQQAFRTAQATVSDLAKEIARSDNPSKRLTDSFAQAQQEVSRLAAAVNQNRAALQQSKSALTAAGVDLSNLANAYKQVDQAARQAQQAQQRAAAFKALDIKPFAQVQAQIKRLEDAYKTLATSGQLSLGELAKAKLQLKDKTAALKGEMNNFGSALQNLNARWLTFAGALAGGAAAIKGITEAGLKMEAVKSQLQAVTGSGEKTAEALAFIRQESNRLGQRTDTMAEGFARLAAAAKGTALEGQPLRAVFSGVADAATVMKLSNERTTLVINALAQMMGKGVVSAEEFRQQLGDHLPQATQVGAKALGVTTAEFIKMLNSGQILANDFLPRFGRALRESVAGGLPEATQGAAAAFNRLYNAVLAFKQSLADSLIVPVLTALANALSAVIETINRLSPVTKSFIGLLTGLTVGFAAWKIAIVPVISAIGSALIPVLNGATLASGVLAGAMRAIPLVALALAVYEGGRALGVWGEQATAAANTTADLNRQTQNIKPALDAAVGQYDAAFAKMAESIKGLTELQKRQYSEQLADLDAKLQQEQAAITAQAALTETEKEQARTAALIAASQERLDLIEQFQERQLDQIDQFSAQEREAKQKALAALNGDELQARNRLQADIEALDAAALESKRGVYRQAKQDLNTHIGQLITEREREWAAAQRIDGLIVQGRRLQQNAILNIQRATMTEAERLRSQQQEAEQAAAEFRAELAKGEQADAKKLTQLSGETVKLIEQSAVKRIAAAKTDWEKSEIQRKAIASINKVQDELNKALDAQKQKHEDNASALDDEMESARDALSEINTAIDAIDRKLLDGKQLKIEIEQDGLNTAREIIEGLTAPATKVITVVTQNAGQAAQNGGLIHQFATGGYAPRSGKLPGYGGGDKVKALLEAGEFIIRKEAVAKLGLPLMHAINQGELPIKRATGGPVGEEALKDEPAQLLAQLKALTEQWRDLKWERINWVNRSNANFHQFSPFAQQRIRAQTEAFDARNEAIKEAIDPVIQSLKQFGIIARVTAGWSGLGFRTPEVSAWIDGVKKFALGGFVPGTRSGDSVPALLTPGEFVLQKSAVNALGRPFIDALNQGIAPPGFASGGLVGDAPNNTRSMTLNLNLNGQTVPAQLSDSAQTRAFLDELQRAGAVSA